MDVPLVERHPPPRMPRAVRIGFTVAAVGALAYLVSTLGSMADDRPGWWDAGFYVAAGLVEKAHAKVKMPSDGDHQGLRVLLAEDNLVNQRVGQLLLQRAGHRVDTVSNGQEAVHAVDQQAFLIGDCP